MTVTGKQFKDYRLGDQKDFFTDVENLIVSVPNGAMLSVTASLSNGGKEKSQSISLIVADGSALQIELQKSIESMLKG